MPAKELNYTVIAEQIITQTKQQIAAFRAQPMHAKPTMKLIVVGDNAIAQASALATKQTCDDIGITCDIARYPADIAEGQLKGIITENNSDQQIDGILILHPLPRHLNLLSLTEIISVQKDVSGLLSVNMDLLPYGKAHLTPCEPAAIMHLLKHTEVELKGKRALIVGRSYNVSRPLSILLTAEAMIVNTYEAFDMRLQEAVKQADIIISCVCNPGLIQGAWVKQGSIVIDINAYKLLDGTLVGGLEYGAVKAKTAWITPDVGGFEQMLIAMQVCNTFQLSKKTQQFDIDANRRQEPLCFHLGVRGSELKKIRLADMIPVPGAEDLFPGEIPAVPRPSSAISFS